MFLPESGPDGMFFAVVMRGSGTARDSNFFALPSVYISGG